MAFKGFQLFTPHYPPAIGHKQIKKQLNVHMYGCSNDEMRRKKNDM